MLRKKCELLAESEYMNVLPQPDTPEIMSDSTLDSNIGNVNRKKKKHITQHAKVPNFPNNASPNKVRSDPIGFYEDPATPG